MNYFSVFYWITVSDGVKHFFDVSSNIFSWFAFASFVAWIATSVAKSVSIGDSELKNEEEDNKNPDFRAFKNMSSTFRKVFYTLLTLSLITWTGYVFIPTKKDCLLIVAGGAVGNFITTDSSAKSIPSDITNFLHLSLQEQMKDLKSDVKEQVVSDAKKQLGIQTRKEKLTDKLKAMTKEEIINYLQSDTTISK